MAAGLTVVVAAARGVEFEGHFIMLKQGDKIVVLLFHVATINVSLMFQQHCNGRLCCF